MWCRFLTFCVLVSFILFVVASCIYGRPSFHLFFHRCCGDDIENDQVIFENFGNNFLKERLVGADIIEADNETLFENEDVGRITDEMKEVLNINDPQVKKWFVDTQISDSAILDNDTEDEIGVKKFHDEINDKQGEENKAAVTEMNTSVDIAVDNERAGRNFEIIEKKTTEVIEIVSNKEFVNVHDGKHNRRARAM